MTDIKYRELRETDKESVLSLFSACFGSPKDAAQWEWEFLGGPKRAMVIVAEADARIVGHYAILPRVFRVGGEKVNAGLVVDVMTHPEYGRRGIFVQSGLEAFKVVKALGLSMVLGFPNEAAIRGHQKVGWTELGNLAVYARPLRASFLTDIAGRKVRGVRKIERALDFALRVINRASLGEPSSSVRWLRPADLENARVEFEQAIEKSVAASPVANARDYEWLRWRLSDPVGETEIAVIYAPGSKQISALGILKTKEWHGRKVGVVLDFILSSSNKSHAKAVLREMLRKAQAKGCEVFISMRSPSAHRLGLLLSMLLLPTPRNLRFIIRSVDDSLLRPKVLNLGNWHLEFIDHDVF